jgi:hypothetical protein
MGQFEELEQELAKLAAKEGEMDTAGQDAMRALGHLRRHRDRSFIVRAVIWLYVAATSVIVAFLFVMGVRGDAGAFSNLSDVLKVAVLPVVTLVIGYYFGTEKSD